MTTPGIDVRGVWKKFHRGQLHDSLRDLIPAAAAGALGRSSPEEELASGDFWALRDLSFQVRPGDALGVIGPNGAGKSTLLKLVNRILRPTRGHIEVRGRAAALIEVAAGFHMDLTGGENIYLQGAIMGMKRSEVRQKFDQIVAFSGLEGFIDTPVKRYSSGMNARLGFSIAAHLNPDVLLIDEVLAVGDFAFQTKAFARIQELVDRGTPVIVVSHQLDRVADLCDRALLLDRGRVVKQGPPSECIAAYVMGDAVQAQGPPAEGPVAITSTTRPRPAPVESGGVVSFRVMGEVRSAGAAAQHSVAVSLRSLKTGRSLYATDALHCGAELPREGSFDLDVELEMNVPIGVYAVEVWIRDQALDRVEGARHSLPLEVRGGSTFWGTVQLKGSMRISESHRQDRPAEVARKD